MPRRSDAGKRPRSMVVISVEQTELELVARIEAMLDAGELRDTPGRRAMLAAVRKLLGKK